MTLNHGYLTLSLSIIYISTKCAKLIWALILSRISFSFVGHVVGQNHGTCTVLVTLNPRGAPA